MRNAVVAVVLGATTVFGQLPVTDGVQLWLKADAASLTTNATGRISQWNDVSGSGNHAVQTTYSTRQPIFVENGPGGRPAIHFDMSNPSNPTDKNNAAGMATALTLADNYTIFLVVADTDRAGLGMTWKRWLVSASETTGANWFLGRYEQGLYAHNGSADMMGNPNRHKVPFQYDRPFTYSVKRDASLQTVYVNGSSSVAGNKERREAIGVVGLGGGVAFKVGSDTSDFYLWEVIAYNRDLTDSERLQVESYLQTKYTVSLEGMEASRWTGGSGLWSGANWDWAPDTAKTNGLIFFGQSGITVQNDLTDVKIEDLTLVNSSNLEIKGNPVELYGELRSFPSSGATMRWKTDMILSDRQHLLETLPGSIFVWEGLLSGPGGFYMGEGQKNWSGVSICGGTVRLLNCTNTFAGPVEIRQGTLEVARLSNAGEAGSLGAASGSSAVVKMGTQLSGEIPVLSYIGTVDSETDRPFKLTRAVRIENNSTNGSAIRFNGTAWTQEPQVYPLLESSLTLAGSSTAVNEYNVPFVEAGVSTNAYLAVTVSGGAWAFSKGGTVPRGRLSVTSGGTALFNQTETFNGLVLFYSGAVVGGTNLQVNGVLLQYAGTVVSPGDPRVNGGIGRMNYSKAASIDGVTFRIQATPSENDSVYFGSALTLSSNVRIEVSAESAAACPDRMKIIEAPSLAGTKDLSSWVIVAPVRYDAVVEGNAVYLQRRLPADMSAWANSMTARFIGYKGSSELTEFPALVKFAEGVDGFSYANCAPNGTDLRFTDSDGVILEHEIEKWDPSGESSVWVNLNLSGTRTTVKAWWNNEELIRKAAFNPIFNPGSIAGCVGWFDPATNIVKDGSGMVTQWNDALGGAVSFKPVSSGKYAQWFEQGECGHPGLRFDGLTDIGLEISEPLTSEYTVFVAAKVNSFTLSWTRIFQGSKGPDANGQGYNSGWAIDKGTGRIFLLIPNKTTGQTGTESLTVFNPGLYATTSSVMTACLSGSAAGGTYGTMNGATGATIAQHTPIQYLTLGRSMTSGVSDKFAGDIYEVIVYNRAVTTEERLQIEQYFTAKYNHASLSRFSTGSLAYWFRGDYAVGTVNSNGIDRVKRLENMAMNNGSRFEQSVVARTPEVVRSASFNGQPVLKFGNSAGLNAAMRLVLGSALGKNYTLITVFRSDVEQALFQPVVQSFYRYYGIDVTNSVLCSRASGEVSRMAPVSSARPMVAISSADGSYNRFAVNNVGLTQKTLAAVDWSTTGSGGSGNSYLYLGAGTEYSMADMPLYGEIAEVLIFNRVLGQIELNGVMSYLGARYGLSIAQPNPIVWVNGFKNVWHFSGTNDGLAAESSFSGNGGVFSAGLAGALAGGAFAFDSPSQYVRTSTSAGSAGTVSFWAKTPLNQTGLQTVFSGTNSTFLAFDYTAGKLLINGTIAASLPSTEDWTHYAVTVTNGTATVYINGISSGTAAATLNLAEPLTFGHAPSLADGATSFTGLLDEVRVESSVRSGDWIRATYLNQALNGTFNGYNLPEGTRIILR